MFQLAWCCCTISNQWDDAINCLDRMPIIFIPQTKSYPMRLFLDESFDIALSEKNSLSRTPTRMQMPLFSPISILLWIWPQKVRLLFCKSQPAAQRCSFLYKMAFHLTHFFSPQEFISQFLHHVQCVCKSCLTEEFVWYFVCLGQYTQLWHHCI